MLFVIITADTNTTCVVYCIALSTTWLRNHQCVCYVYVMLPYLKQVRQTNLAQAYLRKVQKKGTDRTGRTLLLYDPNGLGGNSVLEEGEDEDEEEEEEEESQFKLTQKVSLSHATSDTMMDFQSSDDGDEQGAFMFFDGF